MLIRTLKIAAGRFNFGPDEELDLAPKDARELIACGAAVEVERPKPSRADAKATPAPAPRTAQE